MQTSIYYFIYFWRLGSPGLRVSFLVMGLLDISSSISREYKKQNSQAHSLGKCILVIKPQYHNNNINLIVRTNTHDLFNDLLNVPRGGAQEINEKNTCGVSTRISLGL